jgi:hypothetical protein
VSDSKTCYNLECTEENPQPLENFHKQKTGKFGRRSRCRVCFNKYMREYEASRGYEWRRAKALRLNYGLSLEDYDNIFKAQNGECAICKSANSKHPASELLLVDHCHETGKVRGLLCNNCNRGIGSYLDDPSHLLQAAIYLVEHKLGWRRSQSSINAQARKINSVTVANT